MISPHDSRECCAEDETRVDQGEADQQLVKSFLEVRPRQDGDYDRISLIILQ